MKSIIITGLLFIVFLRCASDFNPQTPRQNTDKLTIRTGTSFGMCVGYCKNDYVFNGTNATLTQGTVVPQAQGIVRSCQSTISQAQWDALELLADIAAFSKVASVLGCPDCTDAGAEYVEVQVDDQQHRVTFPFGKTIPGFESLVDSLRSQRRAFKNCP